jgi:PadR family transcriptional regulator
MLLVYGGGRAIRGVRFVTGMRWRAESQLTLTFYRNGGYAPPRMSTRDDEERVELLQGTLDLLILRTLLHGPAHGHAIAKAIELHSEDVLQVEQGSLYPALHRLIKRGWISAEEGVSENNRRAKFYRLTAKGRKQLTIEITKWEKLARAIAGILRTAGEGKP